MAYNQTISANTPGPEYLLGGLTLTLIFIPLEKYAFLATGVLIFYDYLLTLPLEISEIWSSGWSAARVLFFLNRYPSLLYQAAGILFEFYPNKTSIACHLTDTTAKSFLILPSIAVSGIFTLRTYALYRRSRIVLLVLTVLGLGSIATNIWFAVKETNSVVLVRHVSTCAVVGPYAVPWKLANYATFLVFDTVVFLLTLARTLGTVLRKRKLKMPSGDLLSQLLRDGMLYYFPLLVLYISEICLVTIPSVPQEGIAVLGPFVNALTIILVNRLVLNLRRTARTAQDGDIEKTSSPVFASNSILGNLGESLRDCEECECDDGNGGGDYDEADGFEFEEISVSYNDTIEI